MQEALKLVAPTTEERNKIRDIINEFSKKIRIKGAKTEIGGSIAKDTWLKGEHDIDIYVKFNPKVYGKKDIAAILKKSLEKKHKIENVCGSRAYYRIHKGEYILEVVPILDITKASQAANITDVSPFHVKYVKKHKKLTDQIRLAKAFCKASNIYGAESYIKGFSGYVLEILVIHYGSFTKLLRAASKWDRRTVLDPKQHYKYKNVMFSLNKSKLISPLILVDPVQAERNAAAGVGRDKYDKFIQLAKDYLKKPSPSFFKRKEPSAKELKKKAVVVEATETKGKKDIVGARLMKMFEFLLQQMKRHDFELKETDWQWAPGQKALMWFTPEKQKLEKTKKHYGPPLRLDHSVENFKKTWKGAKFGTEGERCYVIIKRRYTDAKGLLKSLTKDKYLKDKAKSIQIL